MEENIKANTVTVSLETLADWWILPGKKFFSTDQISPKANVLNWKMIQVTYRGSRGRKLLHGPSIHKTSHRGVSLMEADRRESTALLPPYRLTSWKPTILGVDNPYWKIMVYDLHLCMNRNRAVKGVLLTGENGTLVLNMLNCLVGTRDF